MSIVRSIEDDKVANKIDFYNTLFGVEKEQYKYISDSSVRFNGDDRYIITYQMLYNILDTITYESPDIKDEFANSANDEYKEICINRIIAANIDNADFDNINDLLSDVVSLNYKEADNTIKGINNYLRRYKDLTIMDKMSVLRASVYRNQNEKGRVR